jgi:acetyl-CoA acetyltransferase
MNAPTRGGTAVVGAALAGLGEAPGWSHFEIMAQAARAALADCGLRLADVDALYAESLQAAFPALSYAEYLGIRPRVLDSTNVGGSSVVFQMQAAALALEAGLCDVALICYGSNQRTASGRLVSPSQHEVFPYERPYRPRYPMVGYALAAARHMHVYGTTREQLAEVAVAARAWATLNPEAFMRGPLTVDDVLNARMVCDPLTVRDCCLVTDGGGAIVMVRAERARDLPRPPAYLLGIGGGETHRTITMMPDLTTTSAVASGRQAFAMAGLTPADVDVLEIYDAFTINMVVLLEDLGFCPKGEGGRFVSGGRIAPGGSLPLNTYGGGLSAVHPGMLGMFVVVEAVRQLRGGCGARQVDGAEVALAHGNGGMFSSEATALLGTAATV